MRTSTSIGLAAAAVIAALSLAAAQAQSTAPSPGRTFTPEELASFRAALPDAPARETVIRVCGQCHEPQRPASLDRKSVV